MMGGGAYRLEWRIPAATGEPGHVVRWTEHRTLADARDAAAALCNASTTLDGEVRVSLRDSGRVRSVMAATPQILEWSDEDLLPDAIDASLWIRQREAAGARSAILLACRSAFGRAIGTGLLTRDHSATLLATIALALDGEDPASIGAPQD